MTDWTRPAYVYRHIAADGSVLYVGCSSDVAQRNVRHKSTSAWWPEVARVEAEGPLPLRDARDLERALIEEFDPPHNKQYTPRGRHGAPYSTYPGGKAQHAAELAEWRAEWDAMTPDEQQAYMESITPVRGYRRKAS